MQARSTLNCIRQTCVYHLVNTGAWLVDAAQDAAGLTHLLFAKPSLLHAAWLTGPYPPDINTAHPCNDLAA